MSTSVILKPVNTIAHVVKTLLIVLSVVSAFTLLAVFSYMQQMELDAARQQIVLLEKQLEGANTPASCFKSLITTPVATSVAAVTEKVEVLYVKAKEAIK